MAKNFIEVDTYTWMMHEGIETSVYIGQSDEPIEITESYESLIDQHLEAYIFDGKISALHHDETAAFIAKMKEMAEYSERRAKELGWEVES
jgi:hypothetical protein